MRCSPWGTTSSDIADRHASSILLVQLLFVKKLVLCKLVNFTETITQLEEKSVETSFTKLPMNLGFLAQRNVLCLWLYTSPLTRRFDNGIFKVPKNQIEWNPRRTWNQAIWWCTSEFLLSDLEMVLCELINNYIDW